MKQNGKPVRFMSKSLTQAESNYSNIECELLAVLFACEKLHVYIFGREVTVHTDHRPLDNIFRKPVSLAPPRLQRMLLHLSIYDVKVKYVGAKEAPLADTLSRLLPKGRDKPISGLDISIAQVIQIKQTRLATLQDETKEDPVLKKLSELIMTGWPESMQDLSEDLKPYWCHRNELAIHDRLLLKGNRIIIPSSARMDHLSRLHDGHQGLSSTLQRARKTIYWPNMKKDIEDMIKKCDKCQIFSQKKEKVPHRQISASQPMEVTSADIMDYKGKPVLVMIDFYSGYLMTNNLNLQNTTAVTARMNDEWRRFGLPKRLITDNGPCFHSENFNNFCEKMDIHHDTVSPHYHQSNGRIERAIQTIRKIYNKCASDTEITNAILAYHDTPVDADLPTPAELFFNRRINTRLSSIHPGSTIPDEQKEKLSDKRAAHLKPQKNILSYEPGQPVWYTQDGCSEWKPGVIDDKDLHPESYWVITEKNRRLRRNVNDIKPRMFPECQASSDHKIKPEINIPIPNKKTATQKPASEKQPSEPAKETPTRKEPAAEPEQPKQLRRSSRQRKSTQNPDFIYK